MTFVWELDNWPLDTDALTWLHGVKIRRNLSSFILLYQKLDLSLLFRWGYRGIRSNEWLALLVKKGRL